MNVLQVYKTEFPKCAGGIDVIVATLLREAGQKYRPSFLRTRSWRVRGIVRENVLGMQLYALHLPLPPASFLRLKDWLFFLLAAPFGWRHLRTILRDEHADVAHRHTLQLYRLYFVLARRLGGPPYVVTLHGSEVGAYPRVRGLRRLVLLHASMVLAVSKWLTRKETPYSDAVWPTHSIGEWWRSTVTKRWSTFTANSIVKPVPVNCKGSQNGLSHIEGRMVHRGRYHVLAGCRRRLREG